MTGFKVQRYADFGTREPSVARTMMGLPRMKGAAKLLEHHPELGDLVEMMRRDRADFQWRLGEYRNDYIEHRKDVDPKLVEALHRPDMAQVMFDNVWQARTASRCSGSRCSRRRSSSQRSRRPTETRQPRSGFSSPWRRCPKPSSSAARLVVALDKRTDRRLVAIVPTLWVPKTRLPCESAHSQKPIRTLGTRDVLVAAH
jgi:hypothetical protein